LVNLVEDWEVLQDYAGDKQGYYQVLGDEENKQMEIRLAVGRLGFKRIFEKTPDPLLSEILAFCKTHKYARISETIRDELFFR
jgi:hypothetical protein